MLKTGIDLGTDHAENEKIRERKTKLFDPVTVLGMPQSPLTRVKLFCSVV